MTGPFTVVVGVSPTSGSAPALRWAGAEAQLRGGRLSALRAWRPPRPPAAVGAKPPTVHFDVEAMAAAAEQDLRAAVARAGLPDGAVECRVAAGGVRKVLVAASAEADLLVIGAPRRTPGRTHALLARSGCPVVVLPATVG